MRTISSYIRIIVFITISAVFLMYVFTPDAPIKALSQLWYWLILGTVIIFLVAIEVCVSALQRVLYLSLDSEAQKRYDEREALEKANRFKWFKKQYKALLGSKAIEEEHEIILDHNYDGIKELDNKLPPWWIYLFYITILFAAVYLVRFEVFNDYTQAEEYEAEVAQAKIEIEEWKKTAKNLVDVNTITLLTEVEDIKAGQAIFNTRCVACHKADGGGGIGPNLTDDYWILGGGIKNVFNTISEGGRSGKGMVPWKNELKPLEMAQVASYVLNFQGTTPAEPKDPEGEIWVDSDATEETETEINEVVSDSTMVKIETNE